MPVDENERTTLLSGVLYGCFSALGGSAMYALWGSVRMFWFWGFNISLADYLQGTALVFVIGSSISIWFGGVGGALLARFLELGTNLSPRAKVAAFFFSISPGLASGIFLSLVYALLTAGKANSANYLLNAFVTTFIAGAASLWTFSSLKTRVQKAGGIERA